jgi:hypothetical protein
LECLHWFKRCVCGDIGAETNLQGEMIAGEHRSPVLAVALALLCTCDAGRPPSALADGLDKSGGFVQHLYTSKRPWRNPIRQDNRSLRDFDQRTMNLIRR